MVFPVHVSFGPNLKKQNRSEQCGITKTFNFLRPVEHTEVFELSLLMGK